MSLETAFFASRTERGTPTGLHVIVPSVLPEGWSPEFDVKQAYRARLSPDVARIKPQRIPGFDLASGPELDWLGGTSGSGSGEYSSGPDIFSFRDTSISAPEELITVATAPHSRGRDQNSSRRISIFNGSLTFHEHRAVMYDSEEQTDDSDCIKQGTVRDIVFRISGDDYELSQTSKVMIEIFKGAKITQIEAL